MVGIGRDCDVPCAKLASRIASPLDGRGPDEISSPVCLLFAGRVDSKAASRGIPHKSAAFLDVEVSGGVVASRWDGSVPFLGWAV